MKISAAIMVGIAQLGIARPMLTEKSEDSIAFHTVPFARPVSVPLALAAKDYAWLTLFLPTVVIA